MGQHAGSGGRHAARSAGCGVQGGLRGARADLPAPDEGAGTTNAWRRGTLAAARRWHHWCAAGWHWGSPWNSPGWRRFWRRLWPGSGGRFWPGSPTSSGRLWPSSPTSSGRLWPSSPTSSRGLWPSSPTSSGRLWPASAASGSRGLWPSCVRAGTAVGSRCVWPASGPWAWRLWWRLWCHRRQQAGVWPPQAGNRLWQHAVWPACIRQHALWPTSPARCQQHALWPATSGSGWVWRRLWCGGHQ